MTDRNRAAGAVVVVGLVQLLYVSFSEAALDLGIAAFFDWFGALHVPYGTYYLIVGGGYVLAGGLVLTDSDRRFRRVSAVVGLGTAGFFALAASTIDLTVSTSGLADIAVLCGAAVVPLVFLLGLWSSVNDTAYRAVWAVIWLLFTPFVGLAVVGAVRGGWAFLAVIELIALLVLDMVWGYPLYRLGRLAATHQQMATGQQPEMRPTAE